jgi:hypothetical protein
MAKKESVQNLISEHDRLIYQNVILKINQNVNNE